MAKRKLATMIATAGIAIAMLFAVVGLAACEFNPTLAEYQATARVDLTNYANSRGQGNFTTENWSVIQGHVTTGKAAIDAAETKPAVRTARDSAKAAVRAIETKRGSCVICDYCSICQEYPHLRSLVNTNGVFEAAFLDFSRRMGAGASGAAGLQMVYGYSAYVSGLAHQSSARLAKHFHYMNAEVDTGKNYNPPMNFVFYSNKSVSGASLVVRLSADMDLLLTHDIYFVSLNGEQVMFKPFTVYYEWAGDYLPKQDFVLSTNVNIGEGRNIIKIVVRQNNLGWFGTQAAPGFAHVRLENFQGAELLWRPQICNLRHFATFQGNKIIFCLYDEWNSKHPNNQGINSWNS